MKIVFESEKELEDWIYRKFQEENICCVDGTEPHHMIRQMNLGSYGICDLVSFSVYKHEKVTEIEVRLYELKKEKITADAFTQICRYATAINQQIEFYGKSFVVDITCVLIGTEIDESCYILNQSNFMYYRPYFNLDSGVEFKESSSGWHRSNEKISAIAEIIGCDEKENKETGSDNEH